MSNSRFVENELKNGIEEVNRAKIKTEGVEHKQRIIVSRWCILFIAGWYQIGMKKKY